MKRHVIVFALLLMCMTAAQAQGKRVLRENFESNKFQWDEFYEKEASASIQDGYLLVTNDAEGFITRSTVEMPIDITHNFSVKFSMKPKKVNNACWFGIVFNYEDENNYSYFVVQEKKFKIVNRVNGTSSLSRQSGIILTAGRDKDVEIKMEKKGRKLVFSVDNMEVISLTKNLTHNTFGVAVTDKNQVKVYEVTVEQMEGDND